MKDRSLHVLVVDDSAVVRQVLRDLLASEPGLSVSVAGDPVIAEKKIRSRRPDVIILDLELPIMDGLTWLRQRMAEDPIPVIVCSARVGEAASVTIQALEEGAVEVVPKPQLGVRDFLVESRDPLLRAIRAAAGARVRRRGRARSAPRRRSRTDPASRPAGVDRSVTRSREPGPRVDRPPRAQAAAIAPRAIGGARSTTPPRVIAMGASTGGPQALQALLTPLPACMPGIVVVQHMSAAFLPAFARRLDEQCALHVREAVAGDRVEPGTVLIAPGGAHLELRPGQGGADYGVVLHQEPAVEGHRPSVDVLFRSVARVAGAGAFGLLLTGMGRDGAAGLLEMRQAGGATLVESRESCVVFGMPGAALELGAAEEALALDELALRIHDWGYRAEAAADG